MTQPRQGIDALRRSIDNQAAQRDAAQSLSEQIRAEREREREGETDSEREA